MPRPAWAEKRERTEMRTKDSNPETNETSDEAGAHREAPSRDADPSMDEAERLRSLQEAADRKTRELAAAEDRVLRTLAETDNLRKRLQREKTEAIRFANEEIVRDLLPVVDNLELALAHASGSETSRGLAEGVEMVLRILRDVLGRHGAIEVEAGPGTPFDPNVHEALMAESSTDHEPNSIIRCESRGYRLNDRLVRPAKVVVASAPSAPAEPPKSAVFRDSDVASPTDDD